jgi:hypothetical protein
LRGVHDACDARKRGATDRSGSPAAIEAFVRLRERLHDDGRGAYALREAASDLAVANVDGGCHPWVGQPSHRGEAAPERCASCEARHACSELGGTTYVHIREELKKPLIIARVQSGALVSAPGTPEVSQQAGKLAVANE